MGLRASMPNSLSEKRAATFLQRHIAYPPIRALRHPSRLSRRVVR
jgi:hypothetical protein